MDIFAVDHLSHGHFCPGLFVYLYLGPCCRGPFCRGPFGRRPYGRGRLVLDYLSVNPDRQLPAKG
ncbi:hypothetical protein M514_14815 [Trichuris suis]|uniref:Uncharacterized protein n=1 Tax=Trichuris suis TaxID=68888 RepID=A0A085NTW5_9BILA|nr:hypothetical protein M514_14815 [Trichuris suis]